MSRSSVVCVLALAVVACAGPMTSTAFLKERGQGGGTVRVVCPGYPPDAETQAKASEEMAGTCGDRGWKVVGMTISEAWPPRDPNADWAWFAGYGIFDLGRAPPGKPSQQVDLEFVCLAR
jgi:hypothetical protein